jgi:predicted enzyme related to lactoylglutathione lyase
MGQGAILLRLLADVHRRWPPSSNARRGGAVLTFNVRDIDAARAYLETRKDVRFDGETCTIEGWVRLATLYDPDGNVLMLAQSLIDMPLEGAGETQ